jgi:N-acetylmuramoyl-L-alanine amidase
MPTNHTVTSGECVSSIAKRGGFQDPRKVYNDGANDALRSARPNLNVLKPGDVVVVPDRQRDPFTVAVDRHHTFTLATKKTLLRVILQDDTGAALSGKRYALAVSGVAAPFEGSTAGDGKIEHPIPADATSGTLTFWLESADHDKDGYIVPLEIGHLIPVEELSGAQARLLNLAFDCGGTGGTLDDATQAALRGFQRAAGITVNGTSDVGTQTQLRQRNEGT